jgi:hypothetical protein
MATKKKEKEKDIIGEMFDMVIKEAQERAMSPQQMYMLGTYMHMASNEIAWTTALNQFSEMFGKAVKKNV